MKTKKLQSPKASAEINPSDRGAWTPSPLGQGEWQKKTPRETVSLHPSWVYERARKRVREKKEHRWLVERVTCATYRWRNGKFILMTLWIGEWKNIFPVEKSLKCSGKRKNLVVCWYIMVGQTAENRGVNYAATIFPSEAARNYRVSLTYWMPFFFHQPCQKRRFFPMHFKRSILFGCPPKKTCQVMACWIFCLWFF